ncbi:MAG: c-type cytochrome domain-containing protein, partial [Pirellulaceae bacterium]
MVPWIRVPLVFLALACLPVRWGWSVTAVDFSRDIQPLLAEHCLQCHGPDKAEAGLDLTQRDRALGNLD